MSTIYLIVDVDVDRWACLKRGSCRGDEGLSIDETAVVSIEGDAKIWAEHIL